MIVFRRRAKDADDVVDRADGTQPQHRRDFLRYVGVATGGLLLGPIAACSRSAEPARSGTTPRGSGIEPGSESASPRGDGPATVLLGGKVLTVDDDFSEGEAMAVRDGRVLVVGSPELALDVAGPGAHRIDLGGRTVLPGFVEPHAHFTMMNLLSGWEKIGPFRYPTAGEALHRLRAIAEETDRPQWIVARQIDPSLQGGAARITADVLDAISRERPVFVLNASLQQAYCNRHALQLAEVTARTPDPPGGAFGRFTDGQPNGVLFGMPAIQQVLSAHHGWEGHDMRGGALDVCQALNRVGVTTVCDMGTGCMRGAAEVGLLRDMADRRLMTARVRSYLDHAAATSFATAGIEPGYGDELARVVGWMVVADGSPQGRTGWLRRPYLGGGGRGMPYTDPASLKEAVVARSGQGFQIAVHASGDRAIDMVLDVMEDARAQGITAQLRQRIEHCSVLHDEQLVRMATMGLSPSFVMPHVRHWGGALRDDLLGPERAALLERAGSCSRIGVPWTMHSNAPMIPVDPLSCIQTAVTRRVWSERESVLAPGERVSVQDAIYAMTASAAWQCHSDNEIGSLEPGKLADFVVLAEDPRHVRPESIDRIRIDETWLAGQRVYVAEERGGAEPLSRRGGRRSLARAAR